MKTIYTYGGRPEKRNLTVADIIANKASGQKMTQVNALDEEEARAIEESGIDLIITPITCYDEVRAGAPNTYITAVAPINLFGTTDQILSACVDVAGRGADAILTQRSLNVVEAIAREGIAVWGHVGLVPRLSTKMGGMRMVGKTSDEAIEVMQRMRRLEDAGAIGCEVECFAQNALTEISSQSNLVTCSIGAGAGADIIYLFLEDIGGDGENRPRHAKSWGDMSSIRKKLDDERRKALSGFRVDVLNGSFPDEVHSKSMLPGEHEKLLEALDKQRPVQK